MYSFWTFDSPNTNKAPCRDDGSSTSAKQVSANIQKKELRRSKNFRNSNILDIRTDCSLHLDASFGDNRGFASLWVWLRNLRFRTRVPSVDRSARCSGWSASNELIRSNEIPSGGQRNDVCDVWVIWKIYKTPISIIIIIL